MRDKMKRPKALDMHAAAEFGDTFDHAKLEIVVSLLRSRRDNARYAQQLEAEKAELETRIGSHERRLLGTGWVDKQAVIIERLEARIAAAMKHHTRKRPVGFYEDWCDECDVVWPCPTVAGLEGED